MIQEKIDFKKTLDCYRAGRTPALITVPPMNYLMLDGKGDPNKSKEFEDAIEALYSVAYTIKFTIKKGPDTIDFGVMPLEGLWWAKDTNDFLNGNKDKWNWTLMIMQPEMVTTGLFEDAKKLAAEKKNLPGLPNMRFGAFSEGKAVQVMYTGPYSLEHDTILALHEFAKKNGYQLHGYHHEIYMNDARRTAPEKLKTIIRQPVIKK